MTPPCPGGDRGLTTGRALRHTLAVVPVPDLLRDAAARARRHPVVVDAVGAVLLWMFAVVAGGIVAGAGLFLLTTAQTLPLALRRVRPGLTAVVVGLACLVQVALVDTPLVSNVAVLAVAYSAAAHARDRRVSRGVLALGWFGAALGAFAWSAGGWGTSGFVLWVLNATVLGLAVTAAWVLGDVVRRRRTLVSGLREQNRALARDRAQREQLAAQSERAAIAREMHDIVAHSLSVVVVQADGGAYAARTALDRTTGPAVDRVALERAAETLETLAGTARSALANTRVLVGVLREPGGREQYTPREGLADLESLVGQVRDAGVPVGLSVRGDVGELSDEADLAAYRVVQESLTNVLKHAGPGVSAQVEVDVTPTVLLVRVTDDGRGEGPRDGAGNGIVGMTERVEVLGGTLYAGPRPVGGFEVVASVPVRQERRPVAGPGRDGGAGRGR